MNSSITSSEASSSVADFSWSTTSTDSASAEQKNRDRASTGGNSDEAHRHRVEVASSASGPSRRRRQTGGVSKEARRYGVLSGLSSDDGLTDGRSQQRVMVTPQRCVVYISTEDGVSVVRRRRTTFTRPSQMSIEEQLRFRSSTVLA